MSLTGKLEGIDLDFKNIPIIDLSEIYNPDPEIRKVLVDQVRDACMRVGFFYVKNHGISENVINSTISVAQNFFGLPLEHKMEIYNKKQSNFKGYSPLLGGRIKPNGARNLQEGFEIGWEDPLGTPQEDLESHGPMAGANVWPSGLPGFKESVLAYYYEAVKLGKALFPIFALALDLPEDFFLDKTQHSAAMMKLLHYPPQSEPIDERVVGVGPHTDWECFTILWQEPGIQALQIRNSEKAWINAPPIPGTLVINLGDQFSRWTNDVFKSTVHRAANRSRSRRYSIPLFFGTDYNVKLEPISSCVSSDRPARYDVVTAGEYVKSRFLSTYSH